MSQQVIDTGLVKGQSLLFIDPSLNFRNIFQIHKFYAIDQIHKRSYEKALMMLELMPCQVSYPIFKLFYSAITNANNMGLNEPNSFISKAEVNEGPFLKKLRPSAKGRSYSIKKTYNTST